MAQRRLLTDEEHQALFGIPLDAGGMARRFTLSRADQELVAARRRDANRIGFAVQLALLRYPGIALAQVEQPIGSTGPVAGATAGHSGRAFRGEVEDLANLADEDPLLRAADRWRTMHKFAPDLIEALEFRAARTGDPMLAALNLLAELNRSGERKVPSDAPMPFRKDWRRLVMDGEAPNRRLYERGSGDPAR